MKVSELAALLNRFNFKLKMQTLEPRRGFSLDLVEGGRRLSWTTLMAGTSPGHGEGIVSSIRVGRRPVWSSND
jgi:hypothetical protein